MSVGAWQDVTYHHGIRRNHWSMASRPCRKQHRSHHRQPRQNYHKLYLKRSGSFYLRWRHRRQRSEQMLCYCPIVLVAAIQALGAKGQRAFLTTKHRGDGCKLNLSHRLLNKLKLIHFLQCLNQKMPFNTFLTVKDRSLGITEAQPEP